MKGVLKYESCIDYAYFAGERMLVVSCVNIHWMVRASAVSNQDQVVEVGMIGLDHYRLRWHHLVNRVVFLLLSLYKLCIQHRLCMDSGKQTLTFSTRPNRGSLP